MKKEKMLETIEELWLRGLIIFSGSFITVIMVASIMDLVKEIF